MTTATDLDLDGRIARLERALLALAGRCPLGLPDAEVGAMREHAREALTEIAREAARRKTPFETRSK